MHTVVWSIFVAAIIAVPVAARYTDERRANFDIWLPEWLARHNQSIFGTLFVAGLVYTATQLVR